MRLLPLVAWLAAGPVSAGVALREGLPSGFTVDGDLGEWRLLPSTSPGTGPPARVWIAIDESGLAIAGEVDGETERDVAWKLSFPPPRGWSPEVPPWWSEDGVARDCDDESVDDPVACHECVSRLAACREWWAAAVKRAESFHETFSATYRLTRDGVIRQSAPIGASAIAPGEGPRRFEAFVPSSAFPRAARSPLRELAITVRIGGSEASEAVSLETPLVFAGWPALFDRLLMSIPNAFYQPGPDVHEIGAWGDFPESGSSSEPDQPNVRFDDARVRRISAALDSIELVEVGTGSLGCWLVARRGTSVLDVTHSTAPERTAASREGLRILDVVTGERVERMNSGPFMDLRILTLDRDGQFSKPVRLRVPESWGEDFGWAAAPDLSWVEAWLVDPYPSNGPRTVRIRHLLDAATGTYVEEEP